MFERFDRAVKAVVVGSQAIAVEKSCTHVDSSHLTSALLRQPVGALNRVLAENGVEPDEVEAELDTMRRRGGVSDAEVEALAAIGIDVEDMLDRLSKDSGESSGSRRRGFFGGHLPFSDAARRVLLRSLEEAKELGEKRITVDHVLLAVLGVQGPVADVLADAGVTRSAVRRHLGAT
ncbi:Clp protease N-terminal domain-containing protein [Saccharomonospora xinjiangensis]|uniref:Clp amino terminal domain-containing protein n=1 Tax=Saccharomonospora xinjiangensis XJ-54 TaxID=882086 RepID=I0V1N8_9PSEU|nr:Clp protease N-terminal domain-containing protein [Saccharomonospora xinjiangensis]EID54041.1 Clp amino terminal domain-containing protein [Saccharomonospora xinjiangensis XJ-54]